MDKDKQRALLETYKQMKDHDVYQAKMQSQTKPPKFSEVGGDPFMQPNRDSELDLNLPNVIILVSDNVRLIRNNSVPMLQV